MDLDNVDLFVSGNAEIAGMPVEHIYTLQQNVPTDVH